MVAGCFSFFLKLEESLEFIAGEHSDIIDMAWFDYIVIGSGHFVYYHSKSLHI